jgi:hypothetical protein
VFDPPSETGQDLFIDENYDLENRWLAGSLPQSPGINEKLLQDLYENRVLSDAGRLFFDSPADLVPEATNREEDVYEYEPLGVPQGQHACTSQTATFGARSDGCVGLISSGTSTSESAFLDASESGGEGPHGEELDEGGGDVFFVTAAKLVPEDTEGALAAYDAHECTTTEPCVPRQASSSSPCEATESCRPFSYSPPSSETPASGSASGQGNILAQHAVLPSKTTKPKPLTRAQRLAKALAQCRRTYKHSHKKRIACEKRARKRYAPAKKAKARKATRKGHR